MSIESYHFGQIKVDGAVYTNDVIISPDGVNDSWWREKGHEVSTVDLEPMLAVSPDILIIGTGVRGVMKVRPDARQTLEQKCDQVHIMVTDEAVERYNQLQSKEQGQRRVVAALHLTC
ncbi:MAG: Mth938-like domain-containing protein [Planctomycetota bacterium]